VQQQGSVIGSEGKPATVAAYGDEVLEINDLLGFVIADPDPYHGIFSAKIQNIDILAVVGPVEPAQRSAGQFTPFLGPQIKQQKGF